MRQLIVAILFISCSLLSSCDSTSPEKCFGIAVLNTNLIHGFAGRALEMQLESPSVKMISGDKNSFAPMKRKEVIEDKILTIESNYARLNKLKENDDNRDMIKASRAIYDYVLPVYKKEYMELARLYDEEAPKAAIGAYTQSIQEKYYPGFIALHEKLTAAGKPFAEKHGLNVNWNVRTSPQ